MKLKPGVRIQGVSTEVAFIMPAIAAAFEKCGCELTITSVIDGKHSRGSLHYSGNAIDLRTRHMHAESISRVVVLLKDALGDDFDVVKESNHLHLEYDPKEPF